MIKFDTNALLEDLVANAMDAMLIAEDEYKEEVGMELIREHHSQKKRGWAADIKNALESDAPMYDESKGSVVGRVFLPEDPTDKNYVRAMVLAEGNQAEGPLRTKPGRETWDGDISEKKVHVPAKNANGQDNKSKLLPDQFNQKSGYDFFDNARKNFQKRFNDIASDTVTNFDVSRYVIGGGG